MSKLEEIRSLVESHCGDTKEAVREAVAESLVALSPVLQQQQPIAVTESGVCPGGAQGWNEFQKQFKEDNHERLKGLPYPQVRQIISDAWKTHKSTYCAKKTRTRKVKQQLNIPMVQPMLVANNQPSPMIIPTTEPSFNASPMIQQENINTTKSKGKTLKIKNFKSTVKNLQTNAELQNAELYMIGNVNPEFTQYTAPLRTKLAEQQKELQNIYKNYKSQRGQPNNNKTKRANFKSRIQTLQTRKNQVNQNMRALQARVYEKTMKPATLAKKHVRILAGNNVIARTPGYPKVVNNNTPPTQNSSVQPTYKSPNNSVSLLQTTYKSPNNQNSSVQTTYKSPNKQLFSNISPNTNYQLQANVPAVKKSKFENVTEMIGYPNNAGYQKVKINGKLYNYKENNEGKHLIEVLHNNGVGDFGYFNENAPGYFRINE